MTVSAGALRLQTSGDGHVVDFDDRPRERTISVHVVC